MCDHFAFGTIKEEKMKSTYETPEFELRLLYGQDVITTSGGSNNGIEEDTGENDGEWM